MRGCDPGGNRHREFRLGVPKRFVAWHNHAMNFLLPVPTVELVTAECEAFDLEDSLAEEALCLLWEQFPRNTDIRHVLLKVLVLNKLYGTMIHDIEIETVAKHIVGLEIDQRIEEGDIQAVDLIADCPKLKKYVSFASKFCSWHNPTAYPIYDTNVRQCLWSYHNQDGFSQFENDDLWNYQKLVEIVKAFRNSYDLNSLTFKQLDKFMYRSGRQILKARAKETEPPGTPV